MLRVLHLVGSPTDDFHADLSRLYAADCLSAVADPSRYEPVVAYVTPGGTWRFPTDLTRESIAGAESMPSADAVRRLVDLRVDVAIPQLFCLAGMTTYRALLDLLAIPYVGNRPDVMALGADKARARAVVTAAGVDVPHGEVLRSGDRPTLRPPVVVKPVDADNSAGITLVRSDDEYDAALSAAFAHSDRVLVETYVELGREVRCGVLERDGELVALPLEEYAVDPDRKPIRLADDKIAPTADGEVRLVAKDASYAWIVADDDPVTAAVHDAARRAHLALGCRDYSLFDFRIDPDGRPWFLEAGLYCSFAQQSVVSVMAAAAGIGLDDLFADALTHTLTRPKRADPS